MLNTAIFGAYLGSCAGMAYFTAKVKLLDDMERDIRTYREFDFANEKLRDEEKK